VKTHRTIAGLRAALVPLRAGSVGLVPTMGALHAGHEALVRRAGAECDVVVASIFVNPAQFGPGEDFERYPRDEEQDTALAESWGVDHLFVPPVEEMYPDGFGTWVEVGDLGDELEGAARPGHFRGVATVCLKLFNIVRPERAYFGQKDAQQTAVLERMARDLDLGVEIVGAPIVREPDGLAMSSRNVRLEPAQRDAAVCVPRALDAAAAAAADGSVAKLVSAASAVVAEEPLARLEYIEVFDPLTLGLLHDLGDTPSPRLAIAVWFGAVRLIDNRGLS
jgi:pantoate--beta-alanine ligase